jgi:hypothetical protein
MGRLRGVLAIAIFSYLWGAVFFSGGMLYVFLLKTEPANGQGRLMGAAILVIIAFLMGGIPIAIGIGIQKLKKWAWGLAVALSGIALLTPLALLGTRPSAWAYIVFVLAYTVVNGVIFYYLLRPDTRKAFGIRVNLSPS